MEESTRDMVLSLGADACGIANISRFTDCNWNVHPSRLYPAARSVIVFLRRLPRSFVLSDTLITYTQTLTIINRDLDRIALNASLNIERLGAGAMPVPSEKPYAQWNEQGTHGHGLIDLQCAGVRAGMGQRGKGALLIHPQFGNFVNLGAVITNINLRSDPFTINLCIPQCTLCIDACPVHAIDMGRVNGEKCRAYSVAFAPDGTEQMRCNLCRVICPVALGQER